MCARLHHHRKAAFTLVELLVVIGIIALLISILLPSLSRARAAAYTVACSSNMRQIGQAMMMYASDHSGYLPYGYLRGIHNGSLHNDYQITWDDLLSSYLGKDYPDWSNNPWGMGWAGYRLPSRMEVLICPADLIPQNPNWPEEQGYFKRSYSVPVADCDGTGAGSDGTDLSWTMFATYQVDSSRPWPPTNSKFRSFKLVEARDAAGTLLLVERHTDQNFQGNINASGVVTQYTMQQYCLGNGGNEVPIGPNGAHSGKWNYLFADGHVDTLAAHETWGRNPTTGARGNERWWSYGPWTRRTDD